MIIISKIKKILSKKSYEDKVAELAYSTVYDALRTVLNTEVKKIGTDGKEVTDCGLTISKIKMTARMALDFADNLKGDNET